jgi:hypothetical protein
MRPKNVEFHTEQEEDLYTALKRVLQNHIVTHNLSYHQTLGACIPVLGYVLYIMHDAREDPIGLIAQTVAEVQQRTHRRLLRAHPPLLTFSDYASSTTSSTQYQELGSALTMLLTTSGIEYDMAVEATWRVALSLLADVLAMPIYDAVQTPEEIDVYIDSLHAQLPAVIHMWAEEQE